MVRMERHNKHHQKYYWLEMVSTGNQHLVKAYHHRAGKTPNTHMVYEGGSEEEAKEAFLKKQIEKLSRGYVLI